MLCIHKQFPILFMYLAFKERNLLANIGVIQLLYYVLCNLKIHHYCFRQKMYNLTSNLCLPNLFFQLDFRETRKSVSLNLLATLHINLCRSLVVQKVSPDIVADQQLKINHRAGALPPQIWQIDKISRLSFFTSLSVCVCFYSMNCVYQCE